MILKSIKLDNIRSYSSELINFPEGSVLLSGDVGCGKSTILLAVEFALFGLKAGELTGSTLLKHGQKNGSVELCFNIQGKDFIVKRTLKRQKDRIGQSAGFIIENDVKSDLMPKEIKAKVLEILNYPISVISKSQDLIYRFTVFTPQEEMKKIIYEDKEARLETLRKVFNIDKYKRIRENALIYAKFLKEKRLIIEGKISDLPKKKLQKKDLKEKINEIQNKLKNVDSELKEIKEKVNLKKEKVSIVEKKIKENQEYKKQFDLLDLELKNIINNRLNSKKEIDELQTIILKLREDLLDFKEEPGLLTLYEDKERRIETFEKDLQMIRNQKSEIKGKVTNLKETTEKVTKLDNCPLCCQKVSHLHKKEMTDKTNSEIESHKKKFIELEENEKKLSEGLDSLKKEHKELNLRISNISAMRVKKDNLNENQNKLNKIKELLDESKKRVAEINSLKIELSNKLTDVNDESISKDKQELDKMVAIERKIELDYNSYVKESEGIQIQINELNMEIKEKEDLGKKLIEIKNNLSFLCSKFINLVNVMEKHVMLAVYHEFNLLFQQWFNMLIEDENLNVSLDDSFSVTVQQNGFDSSVLNLSGGEKTSVALAYRLALNRVINDVVSEIKTKDLLILDEPTEGFSTDQLDRVRDVLLQIGIKQVVLVSHETKIESFVDSMIKVEKVDGDSRVTKSF